MLERDAILAKIATIKNCLATIERVTGNDPASLDNPIHQDVYVLNLQRATQSAIDMAHLVIAEKGLMLPRSYKHAFAILVDARLISPEIGDSMSRMVGFRNIAVHDYTSLSLDVLKSILGKNLGELTEFSQQIYGHYQADP